jgi:hypothetical protein
MDPIVSRKEVHVSEAGCDVTVTLSA